MNTPEIEEQLGYAAGEEVVINFNTPDNYDLLKEVLK